MNLYYDRVEKCDSVVEQRCATAADDNKYCTRMTLTSISKRRSLEC
jgi:hypothetical protein